MSVFDSIKDFFVGDRDDYDDYEAGEDIVDDSDVQSESLFDKPATKRNRDSRILNVNPTTQLEVVLVKPERFEDASGIADHLNGKKTVVLNLDNTNKDVSRRLVDFLSGVAYANNGQIKRVANSTFIITPYNVGVMGELLDEMENSGMYF